MPATATTDAPRPGLTSTPERAPEAATPSIPPARAEQRPATPTPTQFLSAAPEATPPGSAERSVAFNAVQMFDAQIGWGTAYLEPLQQRRILRTADGGLHWRDISPLEADFLGWYFLDSQTAWVWSRDHEHAWRTVDGGQSWEIAGDFGWWADLGFVDSLHGWKLEAEQWGLSFRQFDIVSFATTQDGGRTWQETQPPPAWGVAYMAYPDAQTAWGVRAGFAKTIEGIPNLGLPYHVVTTVDGGQNWTTRQMPLPPDSDRFNDYTGGSYLGGVGNCEFVSPAYSSLAIWKVALTCETGGWLYTTANQGQTWIIDELPAGVYPSIHFAEPTRGWLLSGQYSANPGLLYRTTNGGQSWELIKRTGWSGLQMSFLDGQLGWAIASACPSEEGCAWYDEVTALVRTSDGGETWEILRPQLIP